MAVITGASRGIGRASAITMAREGARVIVNYNNSKEDAESAVSLIQERGGEAFAFQADVSVADQAENLINEAEERFGYLDILVNNAGILTEGGHLEELDLADLKDLWDVNVEGILNCSQAAAPIMKKQDYGRIVNIASVAGIGTASRPGNMLYSSTKAAVIVMTKSMALDLGKYGINVNAIAPGLIKTDMGLHNKPISEQQERVNYYREHTILGRLGKPEEIAEAVTFLSSDRASFVTGQTLTVDGGRIDYITHSA